jgi:hypothetical protein
MTGHSSGRKVLFVNALLSKEAPFGRPYFFQGNMCAGQWDFDEAKMKPARSQTSKIPWSHYEYDACIAEDHGPAEAF